MSSWSACQFLPTGTWGPRHLRGVQSLHITHGCHSCRFVLCTHTASKLCVYITQIYSCGIRVLCVETVPPSGAGGLRCRSARIDRRSTSSFSNWRAAHCGIEKIKIWENKGALWSIKYHFKIWKIGELNTNIFKKYKSRSTGQIASGAKQELPPHTGTSWFGRPWDSCMRICIDLPLP